MLRVTDHEQIMIYYNEGSDWNILKELWEHRMGPHNKNRGGNEGFLRR